VADVNSTAREVNEEQKDEAFESGASPDLDGEKIGGDDLSPMASKKLFPGRLSSSLPRRFDATPLQDIGNRRAPDCVSQIGQMRP